MRTKVTLNKSFGAKTRHTRNNNRLRILTLKL